MENKNTIGHIFAIITIIIWGTTFISTKILLKEFKPVEILFFRFVMGLLALMVINPHRLKVKDKKQEITFAAAGFCGICLYYLLENIALTYTLASNVGVIISIVPFFTAMLSYVFIKDEERMKTSFFIGFITAMIGICMISFTGFEFRLNAFGDFLAVIAAFVWACYSVLTRKISSYGYNTILTTRRQLFYGIIFMIPALFIFDFKLNIMRFSNPIYLFNIVFLGLGASAFCFVSWNFAVKILGAVKASIYIYMVPVITVATSVLILHEKITVASTIGIILTLTGLIISQKRCGVKKGCKENKLTDCFRC